MGKRFRYEELAGELEAQIEAGTFGPGERLPSVRQLRSRTGLSVTTILEAYHLLEDRGWVAARPKSGYYVCVRQIPGILEPDLSAPSPDPAEVTVSELFLNVLKDTMNPLLAQFGAAIPDPALLPSDKLNRILARTARSTDPAEFVQVPPAGSYELRAQIARRAFLAGCDLKPDDIVITAGCMEALALCLRAVCHPGDMVAIESPSFAIQALEALSLRAIEIPTHPSYGMNLDALRSAIKDHPIRACLVISNFNNPLGSTMPEEAKKELVALLAQRDIPLIEDDIHGELHFTRQRPNVAKGYDVKGLVMLCSSFSKDISPSYRVGWVAPGRFKSTIERLKMMTNLNTAILPQLAIARFLAKGSYEHHLRNIRRAYSHRLAAMGGAVTRLFPAETRVTRPAGGFVLWLQLPASVDSMHLYGLGLQSGITLAPGYIFSATPQYRNFVRLNAAFWSERTAPALERLAALVGELQDRDQASD